MGEHEVEAGVPVPAVPDGEAIEADRALDPRDSREQQNLEQRRERAEQPRDARDADEEVARARDVR